jgi:hypothetical protein
LGSDENTPHRRDFLRASTGLEDLDDRTFARSIGSTVAVIFDAEGPTSS